MSDEALVGWTRVLGLPYACVTMIKSRNTVTTSGIAAAFGEDRRLRSRKRVSTKSEQSTKLLREGVEPNPGPEVYQIFNPEHENDPR